MWRDTKILLIDDDLDRRRDMSVILDFLDEQCLACASGEWRGKVEALGSSRELLCVLLGAVEAPGAGLELIKALRGWDETLPVLLLGQHPPADWPKEVRRQVLASLETPPSYNKLLDSLHRAQVYRATPGQGRGLSREPNLFRSLVGTSRAIQQVRQLLQQVADTDACVLLLGESGTGKEVVARNLHYHSRRREAPFVPVNCSAIAGELLESELFGHEKGAFSGALNSHVGRLELAHGGVLFLEEIDAMPLPVQARLLRVLKEGVFERLGGTRTQSVDVRVIAASHKNLEAMVGEGRFREDLYYRLSVFPIEMSPLRERVEDLPLLLNELIARLEHDKLGSIRFNSAAIMSLCRHDWPGNLRELANLVERMAIMHPYGVIGVQELPKKYRHIEGEDEQGDEGGVFEVGLPDPATLALLPPEGLDLKDYLAALEQTLIQQALDDSAGVVARAAERLRIRRTTLVEKMRKYGMGRREDGDDQPDSESAAAAGHRSAVAPPGAEC
ncbi:sigma-54-dependent Fis family transcriptional regulator [Azotobacter chroococcum]|uniref:sigma-54 dependent transcriptional regulator n=1 Tax=Azotobacter chroococcum TaxID=353 RepID=UPI000B5E7E1D|nr:sigma-54 dependent transcriptional regulator [Azotobacter chroococcum]ASL27214.1 ATPase AAA [Azotobacter chroococcum]TBW01818.1 sigma-54-dependent Fis family transcriptional regulator [Azotobacter chroococcum]TBW37843.1 sigma-54-dependent Fis family transcriptional regulator [Azotobacter chroococcum]